MIRKIGIPNLITIARILLIPVFVLFAVYYGDSVKSGNPIESLRYWAIAIFVIASVSDGIDGFIARRFNMQSKLGAILDPIADKGLLITTVIVLTFSGWEYSFPIWFLVLVLARDIVIIGGCMLIQYVVGNVKVHATLVGKATTATMMVAISWVMLQLPHHLIPVIITGVLTFISGAGYLYDGTLQLLAHNHDEEESK